MLQRHDASVLSNCNGDRGVRPGDFVKSVNGAHKRFGLCISRQEYECLVLWSENKQDIIEFTDAKGRTYKTTVTRREGERVIVNFNGTEVAISY
jgi:hypothetical protein